MKKAIGKSLRILRYEGLTGLLRRLRYRPKINPDDIPPTPQLAGTIGLIDHGYPALTAMVTRFLASHGITAQPDPVAEQPTLHIGWPTATPEAIRQGDILLAGPDDHDLPMDAPEIALLALILDHDPDRIRQWEQRPTGYPHRIVLPPLPPAAAAPQAWQDYAQHNDLALRRCLFFCDWIPADQIDFTPVLRSAPLPLQLCLSLPETPSRTAAYRASASSDDLVIDALLRLPGWTGTAYSYQRLARAALDLGHSEMLVFQDDCAFDDRLRDLLPMIRELMAETGADMFAGIVTDADASVRVRKVIRRDGLDFAILNKSVGLTFNIFGRRALERLASWDEVTHRGQTIDRFLSQTQDLTVLTSVPYLARHRSDLVSTLWYFSNARYDRMIHTSERRLRRRMKDSRKTGGAA
ncbi:hypothetical protein [Paracoccus xiamenensis]|uniref:hypothetical protein n=1 Tax=Paracoccus xiamenensis TaxID=2714901 RepID=UPI00140A0408|nr:hypothetical protein [Paracoccus xiamenensis]NHF74022.1 hypothetical protein [Paracoccus xiamenensis]